MGVLLPESIYVWACGEKVSGQDEDLMTSDELIGYLILLVRRVHTRIQVNKMSILVTETNWRSRYSSILLHTVL